VVRPGVVSDAVIDGFVGVAGALGAEFPYGPAISVFGVEEGDETVERIAIGSLGVGLGGTRTACCKGSAGKQAA